MTSDWPRKGDNPFFSKNNNPHSPTWACISFLDGCDDSLYADAFKEAADKIIDNLDEGNDYQHPDKFFFPISYLYRHTIELKLKVLIHLGIGLDLADMNTSLKKILKSHNLFHLWKITRNTLSSHWPTNPKEDLDAAENIILQFHKIDENGQNLKYSKDLAGNETIKKSPKSADLIHLKNIFDGLYKFLDACRMGLDDSLSIKGEMRNNSY